MTSTKPSTEREISGGMTTLILPGFSKSNEKWAESLENQLDVRHEATVYKWRHWRTTDGIALNKFDPYTEASNIEMLIKDQSKINIISKSIGTLVTAILMSRQKERFLRAILCGIPLNGLSKRWKSEYNILGQVREKEVWVIQNEFDPIGSFQAVEKFIGAINPKLFVIKKEGVATHDYYYISEINKLLKG